MANELGIRYVATGVTLYAIARQNNNLTQVWNQADNAIQTFVVADWAEYAISLTETPSGSYFYTASFPADAPAGTYSVEFYQRSGGTAAITDLLRGTDRVDWITASDSSLPATYPTETELEDFLDAMGVTSTGFDLTNALAAAVALWERLTLYKPFLSDGSTTRYYSPCERGILTLDTGAVSISAVRQNVTDSDAGDLLTVYQDYWPLPINASQLEKPYERIQFRAVPYGATQQRPFSGEERQVSVTGVWGYAATCPIDVYEAILRAAAASILRAVNVSTTGGAERVKQETVEYTFSSGGSGNSGLAGIAAEWEKAFRSLALLYKRRLYA